MMDINRVIEKPDQKEYPSYVSMYIDLLPNDGLILKHLKKNCWKTCEFIRSLSNEDLLFRYAPEKWTIKEILLHIVDDERIYGYRALAFARNDKTELPGFDEMLYAKYSMANQRSVDDLLEEFESVRKSTISLFCGLSSDALLRIGTSNSLQASVRAMIYHIAGHEMHHVNVIREKYLCK